MVIHSFFLLDQTGNFIKLYFFFSLFQTYFFCDNTSVFYHLPCFSENTELEKRVMRGAMKRVELRGLNSVTEGF